MQTEFNNRVFGAVILKSINSNFNADFTHQPRTLPDGVVYSTDKALKYTIKDYLKKIVGKENLFFVKRYNEKLNPLSLNETYKYLFKEYPKAPLEKFALFHFDGENVEGVLPKPKKKQITDYFKSVQRDSSLTKYLEVFEALSAKEVKSFKVDEIQKPNEEREIYFYLDKEKNPKQLEGELEEIKQITEDLDTILTGGIDRFEVLRNLMTCLDIRLFGATFAGETNLSIHGPVQINHGVNKFSENEIYSEDILSPFRNEGELGSDEKGMSTIGNQSNLKEGHYVFHFSINPKNTFEFYTKLNKGKENSDKTFLSNEDIENFKDALKKSVTTNDSSRKIGTENEAVVWIQLQKDSKKVIPSLTEIIKVQHNNGKIEIDCQKCHNIIEYIDSDIEKVEVFYNPLTTSVVGLKNKGKVKHYNILNNEEIKDE